MVLAMSLLGFSSSYYFSESVLVNSGSELVPWSRFLKVMLCRTSYCERYLLSRLNFFKFQYSEPYSSAYAFLPGYWHLPGDTGKFTLLRMRAISDKLKKDTAIVFCCDFVMCIKVQDRPA